MAVCLRRVTFQGMNEVCVVLNTVLSAVSGPRWCGLCSFSTHSRLRGTMEVSALPIAEVETLKHVMVYLLGPTKRFG